MTEENIEIEIWVKKTYIFPKKLTDSLEKLEMLKDLFIKTPIYQCNSNRDQYHISNLDDITKVFYNGSEIHLNQLKGIEDSKTKHKKKAQREAQIFRSQHGIDKCQSCHGRIYDSVHHYLCESCYRKGEIPRDLK